MYEILTLGDHVDIITFKTTTHIVRMLRSVTILYVEQPGIPDGTGTVG